MRSVCQRDALSVASLWDSAPLAASARPLLLDQLVPVVQVAQREADRAEYVFFLREPRESSNVFGNLAGRGPTGAVAQIF